MRLFQDTSLDDWTTELVPVCTDCVNVGMYNDIVPKLRQLAAVGDSLVHILCTAHTLKNCLKSADRNFTNCETFSSFICKKVEQKNAALKKLCEENPL